MALDPKMDKILTALFKMEDKREKDVKASNQIKPKNKAKQRDVKSHFNPPVARLIPKARVIRKNTARGR